MGPQIIPCASSAERGRLRNIQPRAISQSQEGRPRRRPVLPPPTEFAMAVPGQIEKFAGGHGKKQIRSKTRFLAVSTLVFLFLGPCQAWAQAAYSRFEVGVQTSLTSVWHSAATDHDIGVGGRFAYNISRVFALDAQFDFYPRNEVPFPAITALQEGGRRSVWIAGLKAGWHRQKVGLFGKTRPGIISFGKVQQLNAPGQFDRRTHFALELGGVLELYPTERTILRFDVGEMLARYGERVVQLSQGASLIAPGYVASFFQTSVGLSYRIGRQGEAQLQSGNKGRFEIGGQFSWLNILGSFFRLRDEPGYGGRFTYDLYRWLGFDARVSYFYRDPHTVDFQEGGKILQGFFGPKAGIRRSGMGTFLKFQPGFISYGTTLTDFRNFPHPPIPFERQTHFAFNAGGVLEFYPSSQATLRFDAGHVQIFYGPKTVFLNQGSVTAPSYQKTGIEVSTGFGWRF